MVLTFRSSRCPALLAPDGRGEPREEGIVDRRCRLPAHPFAVKFRDDAVEDHECAPHDRPLFEEHVHHAGIRATEPLNTECELTEPRDRRERFIGKLEPREQSIDDEERELVLDRRHGDRGPSVWPRACRRGRASSGHRDRVRGRSRPQLSPRSHARAVRGAPARSCPIVIAFPSRRARHRRPA